MTFGNRNENESGLRPDDPRLTAYAFGELEGEELALVEAAVAADPALRAVVAELRAFGGELEGVLKTEAEPEVVSEGKALRFPTWLWAAAGLAAAASVAVMVGRREERSLAPKPDLRVVALEAVLSKSIEESAVPNAPAVAVDSPGVTFTIPVEVKGDFVTREVGSSSVVASAEPLNSPNSSTGLGAGYVDAGTSMSAGVSGSTVRAGMVAEVSRSWQRPGGALGGAAITSGGTPPSSPVPAPAARLAVVAAEARYRRNLDTSGYLPPSGESYGAIRETGFVAAETESLSTFSIDVDTASYANVRRFLREGRLPPGDAVRIEELINYFPYRYAPPPARSEAPFAANLAVAAAPWAPAHRLVRIGIKGREFAPEARPAANLVFLIDVSGSMFGPKRLPLVKESLRLLVGRLRPDDRVAIVTYAGSSGLALPSTPAARSEEILASLDRLEAGGSTNGGMGIHLAYDIAKANFRPDGINRVILCTDGDFNVGVTSRDALLELVREKARSRVYLTVLGFGMGNYKDGMLELLSNKGNGTYGYIDSAREARKVFVEQVEGTLATIAKDVKIQVEFNPARVASYRLIGYENRMLAKEDFNNDAVDAGDVGAGHTVTALYEIVPTGSLSEGGEVRPAVDPLRYGPRRKPAAPQTTPDNEVANELLTVKIRHKAPDGDVSRVLEFPLVDRGAGFAAADAEFKFATAVAAWGMLLRESPHAGMASFAEVLAWAEDGLANDPEGHRAEFVELVRKARALREARE